MLSREDAGGHNDEPPPRPQKTGQNSNEAARVLGLGGAGIALGPAMAIVRDTYPMQGPIAHRPFISAHQEYRDDSGGHKPRQFTEAIVRAPAGFREVVFAVNCFVATMLALWIAFRLDLKNPWWAMLTVYLTSQPVTGALRAKAVYRLIGTLIDASPI